MQAKSDTELLREYAARASDAAFREIVTRHADLVYASALRQVCSPELARDISQTVFADLVRKGPALGQILADNSSLVGWLYRSTRYAAHTQLRDDRRRQARERQAMENFDPSSDPATEWEQIGPVLDEAMADLSDEDREALLLRYFKNHDFRTIGVALGVSDDAAQKRVSRALERLRAEFHRRGVTTTALALAAAVSANAVTVGPAGLAAALSTAVLTGTTTATVATATKAIAMTTLKKTIIGAALAAAIGTGIYEARQASQLREQNQTLQQQQAPLAEQIQQLQSELNDATNKLAYLRGDNERLSRNTSELLKLRGQVASLKTNSKEEKADDQLVKLVGDWASRATQLKNYVEKTPGARIPEFQFLHDIDWLDATKLVIPDETMATAVDGLQQVAKVQFAHVMGNALHKFIEANSGELPTQLAQLQPFFVVPVGDDVLGRYEMLRSGNVKDLPRQQRLCALVSQTRLAADGSGGIMIQIGDGSFQNLPSY